MENRTQIKTLRDSKRNLWNFRTISLLFFFLCFTLSFLLIGFSILYSEKVFLNIPIQNTIHKYSFSFLFIAIAFFGFILVNYKIGKMPVDRQIDLIVFLISITCALFWTFETMYNGQISSLIFENLSFTIMMLIFGIFLIILAIMLINRPKYRFGLFIQIIGLSIAASSANKLMTNFSSNDYRFVLPILFLIFMVFGISIAYRLRFELE